MVTRHHAGLISLTAERQNEASWGKEQSVGGRTSRSKPKELGSGSTQEGPTADGRSKRKGALKGAETDQKARNERGDHIHFVIRSTERKL